MKNVIMPITEYIKSSLEITGAFGVEITGEEIIPKIPITIGLSSQAFQVTDHKNDKKQWMAFTGVGSGTTVGPSLLKNLGISISTADFPSIGSYFYPGPLNWGHVELDELYNKQALIYAGNLTANRIDGGVMIIIINPMPVLPLPIAWHSIAVVTGLAGSTTSFGAGLMQYYGMIYPT